MLVQALDRATGVVTGVLPWSSSAVPPWPPSIALGSAIGPVLRFSKFAESYRSYRDDLTAGEARRRRAAAAQCLAAPLLCSVSLTRGVP